MLRSLCVVAAAWGLAACGGTVEEAPSGSPPAPLVTVDPASAAAVSGKVLFVGQAPPRKPIDMDANPACARMHAQPALTEEVIAGPDGGLRNVFVYVKAGLPQGSWPVPAEPVMLDQKGCIYTPHVLGVMTGQDLLILNSDTTNHNIHSMPRANRGWNESQPPKGDPKIKQFPRLEIMVPFKCNVHPWMKAYAGVVGHPFFAVSGDDGSFAIKGLPPGAYTLEAWHERYGAQELRISIGPGENKTAEFLFRG